MDNNFTQSNSKYKVPVKMRSQSSLLWMIRRLNLDKSEMDKNMTEGIVEPSFSKTERWTVNYFLKKYKFTVSKYLIHIFFLI